MANYKTIFKHPIIGLKVGVDENNKAHLLKLFNREVEGNDSPTPTPESNLDNGEGTYSLKQKAFLSNTVDGNNSVALGGANTVDGNLSFAVGSTNRVSNDACVALGVGLTSDADNQILLGEYNVTNPNATLILGVGEQETDKLNAVEVLNDGSVYVKNVGNYDGTNSDDEDVKDLATVIENFDTALETVPLCIHIPPYATGTQSFGNIITTNNINVTLAKQIYNAINNSASIIILANHTNGHHIVISACYTFVRSGQSQLGIFLYYVADKRYKTTIVCNYSNTASNITSIDSVTTEEVNS